MNWFEIPKGEVQLWWASLHVDKPHIERLRGMLDPVELQRSERFRVPNAARRFIAARAALRIALSRVTGIAPSDLEFRFGKHGKPYLAENALSFNASDSGDFMVVALASAEVGVDIELVRDLRQSERLARRICTERELEMLDRVTDHERGALVHRLWTCKEAALKAIGTGLPGGLHNVEVEIPRNGTPKIARLLDETSGWSLLFPETDPNLLCTVVIRGTGWRTVSRPFSLSSA